MRRISKLNLRALLYTALATSVICITSLLTVPFAVPITLQLLGIYLALFLLGGRLGTLATLLYIALGAVGLPVFSGFSGGISRLFDATGGYIFGFLIAALFYWIMSAVLPKSNTIRLIIAMLSLLLIYVAGTLWYAFVYLNGMRDVIYVLCVCVFPFVIPDVIKIAIAYIVAERLTRVMKI